MLIADLARYEDEMTSESKTRLKWKLLEGPQLEETDAERCIDFNRKQTSARMEKAGDNKRAGEGRAPRVGEDQLCRKTRSDSLGLPRVLYIEGTTDQGHHCSTRKGLSTGRVLKSDGDSKGQEQSEDKSLKSNNQEKAADGANYTSPRKKMTVTEDKFSHA